MFVGANLRRVKPGKNRPDHVPPAEFISQQQQHTQGLSANDEVRPVLSRRGIGRHVVRARPKDNARNIKPQIVKVNSEAAKIT
jgi:hypothetical protein